jgi:hypothetical protein
MHKAHHISGIAATATAALLFSCADPTSAPPTVGSPVRANAVTASATLAPEQLSGTVAIGVNENGDAVGDGTGAVSSCSANSLPKLWRADGTVLTLPMGTHCGAEAVAINNSGEIVGRLFGPPASGGWLPDGSGGYTFQEFEYVNGNLVRVLGGLNDGGEIVGWANNAQMYWRTATTSWTLMTAPAGAAQCQVRRGINNLGAIVAACSVNGVNGGYMTGYYWANHSATPIVLPRPTATGNLYPTEINDAGVIVGFQNLPTKAVRWTPNGSGGYTVAYLPDAGHGGAAYGLARDGTVSGSVLKPNGYGIPVLWPASGSYQVLPVIGKPRFGEANDVATSSSGGPIAVGYQDSQALRWK